MKRAISIVLLLLVGLSVFAQEADPNWYLNKPIKDIRFQGLIVVEKKQIDPIVLEFKNKEFTEELWIEILSRVLSLELFETPEAEVIPADSNNNSVIIVFKVVEKPAVGAVLFSGNKGLRSNELKEEIDTKEATIFNEKNLRLDALALKSFYQSKGFPDAKVTSSFTKRPSGQIDVVFTITEGTENLIEKINIEGNSVFSVSTLKGQLKIKEKGLFQAGRFNEAQIEESRESVELYYKKRGYMDARVTDVQRNTVVSEKTGANMLTLTFVIEEGIRYTYGGMTFSGNTIYTSEELLARTKMSVGSVLNYERLIADQTNATDLYFENGYIFNNFNITETRDEENASIAYNIAIVENPQAHIEDIIFRGNLKTEEIVLQRLVPLQPGDIFSKAKLFEGLRALYNTQYFSAIVPEYEQGSQDLFVDLVINVEEQSTASVQFGLTYSPASGADQFPITGVIKFSDINFLGKGLNLSLDTEVAVDEQTVSFSFADDWLFGKEISGSIQLAFKHELVSTYQDSVGRIFNYGESGAAPDPYNSYAEYAAAGYAVPDEYLMNYHNWSFSLGYSTGFRKNFSFGSFGIIPGILHEAERVSYDASIYRPFYKTVADNYSEWLFTNTIYTRGYFNNLDLWYNPSSGVYVSQRLGLSGWFKSDANQFLRSDSRLEAYATLFDIRFTDTYSLKGIIGGHTKFSTLMEVPWRDFASTNSKMLEIDGTFVGRGWSDLDNVYGKDLWESWVEFRLPVVPNILSIDAFCDAALINTTNGLLDMSNYKTSGTYTYEEDTSLKDMGLNNFAFSVGAGLRFILLQFPFRVYFAKRFVYNEANSSFNWASDSFDFVLSVTTSLN